MRLTVIVVLGLVAVTSAHIASAIETSKKVPIDLEQAQKAYTEAKALGHKATSLLHARSLYQLARKYYLKQPQKLAPYALSYAMASAAYGDKAALYLFQETLNIYVSTYGTNDQRLVLPLINAAEEALRQNEPEMAYAWFRRARKLLSHTALSPVYLARATMGLARLHAKANEKEKAVLHAHKALKHLNSSAINNEPIIASSMLRWLGNIELAAGNDLSALKAYNHALDLLKQHDPEAKEIYILYTSLVAVNHKLGREKEASSHCLKAEHHRPINLDYDTRHPLHDPDGRLSALETPKQGEISATFVKGADCRLHNIEIHHATGLSHTEAKALLSQAYFSPIFMNGKISDGEYASLARLGVYQSPSKK
jgi:tetratricopeptide (TPR) repeat protein